MRHCLCYVLTVPKGTKAAYAATAPWSSFAAIVEQGGEGGTTEQCATPTISYADGKLKFECATTGAEYHYTITDPDMASNAYSQTGEVELKAYYNISVYATSDGYKTSETATGTLYWLTANLKTTGLSKLETRGILATADNGTVTISGLDNGENVSLYSIDGKLLDCTKASGNTATLNANTNNGIVIVKVAGQSIKIAM